VFTNGLPSQDLMALSFIALLSLVLLMWGVHRRWFARFRHGFFYSLFIAFVGTSLWSLVLLALWGYEASDRLFVESVRMDLAEFSGIVQSQFKRDLEGSLGKVNLIAGVAGRAKPGVSLEDRLRLLLEVDPRFRQLTVFTDEGKTIAEVGRRGRPEEVPHVPVAYALDGEVYTSDPFFSDIFEEYLLNVSLPLLSEEGQVVGAFTALLDFDEGIAGLFESARFGRTGYAVLVNASGRVIAHPDKERIGDDIRSYPAVQRGLEGYSGSLTAQNKAGENRLFFFHPLKSSATQDPETLVLLTELAEEEATAPLSVLREEILVYLLIIALASFVVAQQLAKSLKKPISRLANSAERVGSGDFSQITDVTGKDSIGRLGEAFNHMVSGLRERDKIKDLFGRYLTTQISEEVLKGEINLGGVSRPVTILISDIRGFTSMSEHMDPQEVVAFLNAYFSEMVEAVLDEGGVLDKFLGDGLLAVFGAFGEASDHAHRAVRCALRMKALLAKINGERIVASKDPIAIGIGIHTEDVVVGNIGSRKRLEYTVIGDGVNTTSRVEGLNKEFGTTILITGATYRKVEGDFVCRLMPESSLRGKTASMKFYEVISARQ